MRRLLVLLLLVALGVGLMPGVAPAMDFFSAHPDLAIPDYPSGGVTHDIVVGPGYSGAIIDLSVSLSISHTYTSDLIVTLTHVDTATQVTLIDRRCASDNISVVLDDSYPAALGSVCPMAGVFHPDTPLGAFYGQDMSGTWRLSVRDTSTVDVGTLRAWSLAIDSTAALLCYGKAATIVGTAGADTLIGTAGPDVILGLGGNDTITGLGGNDRICGGRGADQINGGAGLDRINGGPGADILKGLLGNDRLAGGGGNDRLEGGGGTDMGNGGEGTDVCLTETTVACE